MSGKLALNLALCAFALLTVAGLALPELHAAGNQDRRRASHSYAHRPQLLQTLGIAVSLALLAGIAGWWTAALVLSAIGLLLLLISARSGLG